MKKLLAILLMAALLCAPAMAEADDAELVRAIIPRNTSVEIDLDGDGTLEEVLWDAVEQDEYTSYLTLTILYGDELALQYDTEFISAEAVYAADMDGDGVTELLVSGDVASDDYYTICLHYADGAVTQVPFADGDRGENGAEDKDTGYGMPVAMTGNTLTLSGSQDVLGTWFATRVYALADGRFGFADGGEWVRDMEGIDLSDETFWAEAYAPLTAKIALPCAAADGSAAELPAGTKLLVTASDKVSFARFVTQDGFQGTLAIEPDAERGWGMRVNGVSEDDCFDLVPYAD